MDAYIRVSRSPHPPSSQGPRPHLILRILRTLPTCPLIRLPHKPLRLRPRRKTLLLRLRPPDNLLLRARPIRIDPRHPPTPHSIELALRARHFTQAVVRTVLSRHEALCIRQRSE